MFGVLMFLALAIDLTGNGRAIVSAQLQKPRSFSSCARTVIR
jgi:hypothetical protein